MSEFLLCITIAIETVENIPLLSNKSKDLALLDNITICGRVEVSYTLP
ncbi:MAG: hypothetical protein ACYS6W_01535 [Planctomycetota bacterium]|jgi:hypothetical protein